MTLIKSDVIIDFKSYLCYDSDVVQIDREIKNEIVECSYFDCTSNESLKKLFKLYYDNLTFQQNKKWENFQYMLCSSRVLEYVLRDKHWAQLVVKNLRKIKEENVAVVLKQLHLFDDDKDNEKKKKNLIFKLVSNHETEKEKLQDLVTNKSKELIFLLYEASDVEKTFMSKSCFTSKSILRRSWEDSSNDCSCRAKITLVYWCCKCWHHSLTNENQLEEHIRTSSNKKDYFANVSVNILSTRIDVITAATDLY